MPTTPLNANIRLTAIAVSAVLGCADAWADTYNFGYSASWFGQIGLTQAILNNANGGNGYKVGIVDTGINLSSANLAGRIDTANSGCAAVSFGCASVADNNGHGSSVAMILGGANPSASTLMMGVAPKVTFVAAKSLSAAGSGTDADVAAGLRKAADGGANVINVSITYIPTANIINAINYAAGKGAVIVWAAGNSNTQMWNGNTTLSAEAAKRIIYVGAVDGNNVKASFSNTAGSYGVVANGATTAYKDLWLMAPGVNIVAGSKDANYYYWSGTSMSAPVVTGAVALIETAWPILHKNGTTAKLLLSTAKDLGAAGSDATYGKGELSLGNAWKPQGDLMLQNSNGTYTLLKTMTSISYSGALSGAALKTYMQNYTSFDSYYRNFSIDLTGLVGTKPTTTGAKIAASGTAAAPTVTSYKKALAGGAYATVSMAESMPAGAFNETTTARQYSMKMVEADGRTFAYGAGMAASAGFADALWGEQATEVTAAGAHGVMGLADGGKYGAVVVPLNGDTRLGMSWSGVRPEAGLDWNAIDARAMSFGITSRVSKDVTLGFNLGSVIEHHGVLGSSYDPQGLMSMGEKNRTMALGLTASIALNRKTQLALDLGVARTAPGAGSAGSLLGNTDTLLSRQMGAALSSRDVGRDGDVLTVALRKPLRLISGSTEMTVSDVAADGTPIAKSIRASLVPTGSQTDLTIGYSLPLRKNQALSFNASHSKDVGNVAGEKATGVGVSFNMRF